MWTINGTIIHPQALFSHAICATLFLSVVARKRRLPRDPFFRVFIVEPPQEISDREVVQMSPYEILIVVFTVMAIIVGLLIEYIKK